ncbi:MAG: SWIM zinc finger family protein [Myxococcales bacterium]|nr:SWIM zinc finger family protein [Myxococcales bacterium]
MSRWRRFGWYESAPKKPPPERGIRMKKAGTTWWGQRWLEALENVLRGDSARLARGRTYARAGRTHDLVVKGGKVTAKVTGSRATPYKITIELTELGAPAWKKAIDGLAEKAQFSAELLAGQMPQAIDEVFLEARASLFPTQRADLRTSCSCPDWGDPCKHVAATHYVLGEALDRDPFLLFELRGRTKDQVLDALRAARGGVGEMRAKKAGGSKAAPQDASIDVPTVKLGQVKAREYDQPRGPLPALHFSFEPPVTHGAVLRQLGAPTAWQGDASPADVLAPLVRAAAETARRIALAEPSESSGPGPLSAGASERGAKPRAPKPGRKGR